MTEQPITNPAVHALFAAYPEPLRSRLMLLRQLILQVASETAGVGTLEETLKWGQPSYLTVTTKSGSTVRIDQVKTQPDQYAVYFNCNTDLVDTFRQIYPDEFVYEGNRSIILNTADEVPVEALKDCIGIALTYHLDKKRRKRA